MYVCGLSPKKRLDWLGLGKVFSKKCRIRVLYFIFQKSGKINTKYLKQKSLNIRLKNTRNKKLPIQMIVTKVISNSRIVTLVAVLLKPIWCLMWKCYMETWVLSVLTICAMKSEAFLVMDVERGEDGGLDRPPCIAPHLQEGGGR